MHILRRWYIREGTNFRDDNSFLLPPLPTLPFQDRLVFDSRECETQQGKFHSMVVVFLSEY